MSIYLIKPSIKIVLNLIIITELHYCAVYSFLQMGVGNKPSSGYKGCGIGVGLVNSALNIVILNERHKVVDEYYLFTDNMTLFGCARSVVMLRSI